MTIVERAWSPRGEVVLRRAGDQQPTASDALYDSAAIPHDTRWDLLLPGRQATLRYLEDVRDRVLDRLRTVRARVASEPE